MKLFNIYLISFLFVCVLKTQTILPQNKNFFNEVVQNISFNQDELAYIELAKLFDKTIPELESSNSQVAQNAYTKLLNEYNNFISQNTNSKLIDDAYLMIAQAARRAKDFTKYIDWLNYINTNFKSDFVSYINFINSTAYNILQPYHSSFVESSQYAMFKKAQIYFNDNFFFNNYDYTEAEKILLEIKNGNYNNIIYNLAQYNICYLNEIKNKNNFNIQSAVFDKYYNFITSNNELELVYSALNNAGELCKSYGLVSEMNKLAQFCENNYSKDNYLVESRFLSLYNKKWTKQNITYNLVNSNTENSTMIENILKDYQQVFNNYLTFTKITTNPDITITLNSTANNTIINYISTFNNTSPIVNVIINIKNNENINKLKEIIAHEIGHALGLGHSFNSNDLMYFTGNSTGILSDRDKNTLKSLYTTTVSLDLLTTNFNYKILPNNFIYFQIKAQNLNLNNISFSLRNNPSWLKIDEKGIISGLPPQSSTSYNFDIRITDSHNIKKITNTLDILAYPVSITNNNYEKKVKQSFEIFPNPSNKIATISFVSSDHYQLKIIRKNILGQTIDLIFDDNINKGNFNIPIKNNIASGYYFYYIFLNNELYQVLKSIVLH